MPRGSRQGERRGGRQRGTLNRKTLERQRIAAQLATNVPADMIEGAAGPLAKDVLRFWMNEFDRLARHHRRRDAAKSKSYADAAIACAVKLAPFESPTYRAIVLSPPPPPSETVRRFTLRIFDPHNGPAPPPDDVAEIE